MFARDQVIELQLLDLPLNRGEKSLLRKLRLARKIDELAFDCRAMNVEQASTATHGNAGAEKFPQARIHATFFLMQFESSRGVREAFAACLAAKALDEARFALTIKSSVAHDKSFAAKIRATLIGAMRCHGRDYCKWRSRTQQF